MRREPWAVCFLFYSVWVKDVKFECVKILNISGHVYTRLNIERPILSHFEIKRWLKKQDFFVNVHAWHSNGLHIIAGIATIAQKNSAIRTIVYGNRALSDQNDCMETVRSAIATIAEIEHFLSQRSYNDRDHCDATIAERTVSIQSFWSLNSFWAIAIAAIVAIIWTPGFIDLGPVV